MKERPLFKTAPFNTAIQLSQSQKNGTIPSLQNLVFQPGDPPGDSPFPKVDEVPCSASTMTPSELPLYDFGLPKGRMRIQ